MECGREAGAVIRDGIGIVVLKIVRIVVYRVLNQIEVKGYKRSMSQHI